MPAMLHCNFKRVKIQLVVVMGISGICLLTWSLLQLPRLYQQAGSATANNKVNKLFFHQTPKTKKLCEKTRSFIATFT
jgi:hypothetical protein